MDIRIDQVNSRKVLKKFIKFPWSIYANDPYWVPPLIRDMKEKLDIRNNPFFEHAELKLFMASRAGKAIGRIAGVIDENHNSRHKEKIVFFGLFESCNDAECAGMLLNAVEEWGRDHGMAILRGPMNLSMNDECAFLFEGFESPPVIMMPYNPPYYLDLMEKCGLGKAKDLFAFYMKRDHKESGKIRQIVEKVRAEIPVQFRIVDLKNIFHETEKIMHIYNNAWSDNWGFVPWTAKEMDHMAAKLKQLADPNLIILAEFEGKPVGFAFGLPNYNEILSKLNGRLFPFGIFAFLANRKKIKGVRAVVFGILKEFQHTGLSYLLYSEFEKNVIASGYEWCETSWQLEDNEAVNRFTASLGGKIYKKYRIFEKRILDS